MSKRKNETSFQLKRVQSRYIMIDEDIFESLDSYSLSLYTAFRYESDFDKEDATLRRSAQFLYNKAKISRAQFYRCLNVLEDFGLISRDENNGLGSMSIYHVARTLNYFNTDCRGVSERDGGGVSDRDTYQYPDLNHINMIISVSDETNDNKIPSDQLIVDAYHEELSECPKIKVVDRKLQAQFKHMIKNWPKYQKDGNKFSIESFRDYLNYIKLHYSWFVNPYVTSTGNTRQNNLRVLTREINITKIVNGEFNAN